MSITKSESKTGLVSTAKKLVLLEHLPDCSSRLIAAALAPHRLLRRASSRSELLASTEVNANRSYPPHRRLTRPLCARCGIAPLSAKPICTALREARSGKAPAVRAAIASSTVDPHPPTPYLEYEPLVARPRSSDQAVAGVSSKPAVREPPDHTISEAAVRELSNEAEGPGFILEISSPQ